MNNKKYRLSFPDSFFRINSSLVEEELNISCTVTMINEVDLSLIEKYRANSKNTKFSYTVFVAKAIAKALIEYPEVNRRFYRPFIFFPRIFQNFNNVDIAVASELTDPQMAHVAYIDVLRDVQSKSLVEIQSWLLNFRNTTGVQQWKTFSGIIKGFPYLIAKTLIKAPTWIPSLWTRYRGGACMISSPAKYGVDSLVACWMSPVGVSFGYVKNRAIVKDGEIKIAPTFNLTINFDRRIISGAQCAKFIARVCTILENFEFDIEE